MQLFQYSSFQIEHFSRYYKNLINARVYEFDVCTGCFKYCAKTEECTCPGEPAEHISGAWKLDKIVKTKKVSRLYFEQDGNRFCHCVFATNFDQIGFKENTYYYLEGWQRKMTRHNCLIIYESVPPTCH